MRSYGGIDITQNLTPPKSLYAEVICIEDAGDLELESGKFEQLKFSYTGQEYLSLTNIRFQVKE